MTVPTIILTALGVVIVETVGFLVYKTFRMDKKLTETTNNLNELSECVLRLAKAVKNVDVVEVEQDNSDNFNFPNKEGF